VVADIDPEAATSSRAPRSSEMRTSCRRQIWIITLCLMFIQAANAGGWMSQDSGTLAGLRSIYFVDDENGWIVGSRGTLLTTSDGGVSWKQQKKFTTDNIRDVYLSDPRTGLLLCEGDVFKNPGTSPSYLLRTVDGGRNWQRIDFPGSSERIARLVVAKGGRVYAVGEGGVMWEIQGEKPELKKTGLPIPNLILAGKFTDELNGVIAGGRGAALFTMDGGVEWNRASVTGTAPATINSVFFVDKGTGWMAGAEGKLYFTSNGGRAWSERSSGVSADLLDVFFVNSKYGVAVGDQGTIIETSTGGDVWNRVNVKSASRLERVWLNSKRGFAIGYGGTILRRDSD